MKFFIKTFGCQINNYDSNKLINLLKKRFIYIKNLNFDILIINTCSVREFCQKKIFFFLKKNKFFKSLNILTGCSINIFFNIFIKKYYIDIILNLYSLFYILNLIYMFYFYKCKQILFISYYNKNKNLNFIKNKLYIIIMEGCNKYCSYCIIPYTKGREIYFNILKILKEIFLLKSNIKEIYFFGQNVNSYKYFLNDKLINFYSFLETLYEFFNNFQFYYITSNFKNLILNLKFYKKIENLHLPLQSSSNYILTIMKRNYTFNFYKNFIYYIKGNLSLFNFNTDIIICFPGENNKFFNKTLISIEKILFDKSYVFIYNKRSYTSSIFFFNNIKLILKKKRFLKINLKLKNNVYYINKLIMNKLFFCILKNIFLLNNNLFFIYYCGRIVLFLYSFKNIKMNIFLNLKFFKKISSYFFSNIY
ncbi:radical SAM protein [Candidatus Nasuia deltocephalinicola]|uniref:radical SAM protein n=1 Tax=Candidatus Nasuia deltocephalincola TaxID=1160784 RepID=UPI00216AD3E6|nr:radical SAM protein [Candidatus Nasuia deltocephalinicola]